MRTGLGWLIAGAVLVAGVPCALIGCTHPPDQAQAVGSRAPADEKAPGTRHRAAGPPEGPTRTRGQPPSVEALLDGSLDPDDCSPEFLAAAAQVVLGVDFGASDEDRIRRLDLIRRMGPAAAGVIEQVIEWGGGPDDEVRLAGWNALDAIDPERTLRVPVFLAQEGTGGRAIDADEGLYRIGSSIVPTLIAVLEGRSKGNRHTCVEVLEHLGPDAAEALPILRRMAAGGDEDAGKAVFYVSGEREFDARLLVGALLDSWEFRVDVGEARPGLVRELADLLGAEDAGPTRLNAALVLVRLAPETEGLAVALAEELDTKPAVTFDSAPDALKRLGPLAAPAIPLLVTRRTALTWTQYVDLLAATQDRDRGLPALREAFDDSANVEARPELARALVKFGNAEAERVLPTLIEQMTERYVLFPRGRRWGPPRPPRTVFGSTWAAQSLGALGPRAAPAIPALIGALDEGSNAVDASVEALARIGPPAVPLLVRAIDRTNSVATRTGAARALGRIEMLGADASDALRTALTDPAINVRGSAAAALLRSDSAVPSAVPVLREALESTETALHGEWLGMLGPESAAALPAVNAALGHTSMRVRVHAGRAAYTITGDAGEFVNAIRDAVLANDGGGYAYEAMKELGPAARDAVPAVATVLRKTGGCPGYVAAALIALGPAARGAAPALAQVVETGLDHDVKSACEVLEAMGPAAEDAVPGLLRKLERSCSWPQASIIRALGAIGPAAEPAVPAIRLRLNDYWRSTREVSRAAIENIEGR